MRDNLEMDSPEKDSFTTIRKNNSVIGGELNIGYYYEILDKLYYQWKLNSSQFITTGKEQYIQAYQQLEKLKEFTETKKLKLNKMIGVLREKGALRLDLKTRIIKVNFSALEKNIPPETKKLFWIKMKEDYGFFQHLVFYNFIIVGNR